MKRFFVVLVSLLIISTITFGASGDVFNNFTLSGDEINVLGNENEILSGVDDENIMLVGDSINAKGTAEDLIILAGENINSEAVGQYGFMAANSLNISGDILKDNFVAGNRINVIGNVGRDAYLFGTTINIDGAIGRNVYACGGEININGVINGNIEVAANKVFISSDAVINGDINIDATHIKIEDGVQIGGIVTYNSNAESVSIPDNVLNNMNQIVDIEIKKENVFIEKVKDIVMWMIINIILFAITMLISPKLFEKIENAFKEKEASLYGTSIGYGIILLILIPLFAIIALITVIGSALGFAGILAYIVIMVYSTVITGYLLGATIFSNRSMNKYLVGIIGIVIVEILRKLPVIGGVISFLVVLIAFGVVKEILSRKKEKLPTEE